jgi:hypothetical protein
MIVQRRLTVVQSRGTNECKDDDEFVTFPAFSALSGSIKKLSATEFGGMYDESRKRVYLDKDGKKVCKTIKVEIEHSMHDGETFSFINTQYDSDGDKDYMSSQEYEKFYNDMRKKYYEKMKGKPRLKLPDFKESSELYIPINFLPAFG